MPLLLCAAKSLASGLAALRALAMAFGYRFGVGFLEVVEGLKGGVKS